MRILQDLTNAYRNEGRLCITKRTAGIRHWWWWWWWWYNHINTDKEDSTAIRISWIRHKIAGLWLVVLCGWLCVSFCSPNHATGLLWQVLSLPTFTVTANSCLHYNGHL